VVGGENHFTRNDLRPFFEAPANVPILQPDPMRGGYSELRKIAAAAEPWGITIAPHLFHEQMVHLLAAIPNASYLEYMDWNDDLWVEPIKPNGNGMMIPPERPGHGLAFRPEVLKDHRIGGSRMGRRPARRCRPCPIR
jgi:L-alanine-DL-glutamate epimerase-like enolase superfamily enzyme